MRTVKNQPDPKVDQIEFGVEIETAIPVAAGIRVGGYHSGAPVTRGQTPLGASIPAPAFGRTHWRADRDGSIRCGNGYQPCEFVSPRLRGVTGIERMREFLSFANAVGATVNDSCGLHVTIGVRSILGTADPAVVGQFVRKLVRHAHRHAWAIYGQTGTGRHLNRYSHQITQFEQTFERLGVVTTGQQLANLVSDCGRGMVNLLKCHGEDPAIEFRAFAATLDEAMVLHHLATVFGLCRKAASTTAIPNFRGAKTVHLGSAEEAVRRLWRVLGWADSTDTTEIAFGLAGPLHSDFFRYRGAALNQCRTFDRQFPRAFATDPDAAPATLNP